MGRFQSRIAVLALSLLGLAFLFLPGDRLIGGMARTAHWQEKADGIYAQIPLSWLEKKKISVWWDEENHKYMLFLPSFCKGEETIFLHAGDGSALFLDGSALAGGKVSGLKTGAHTLQVGKESYPLEVMRSEALPALFLEMDEKRQEALYEQPYTEQDATWLSLIDEDARVCNEAQVDGFRVRGNTSADWVKKPYQLRLSQAQDFLDMGAAVKWVLLSNWSDKTLLRNKITYDMAADAGMPYSPQSRFVDLYLNGEYQGCYQLCEKTEIGPERINIRNLEDYTLYEPSKEEMDLETRAEIAREDPLAAGIRIEDGRAFRGYDTQLGTQDLSGGYLLEIERPSRIYASASFFVTSHGQPVTVKRPKYADWQEVAYIASKWQDFEDALFAEDGCNPESGLPYSAYIDMTSFANKYLVEEIVRNYDASSTSQYFYKDAQEENIYAGPVWDYDMSLGNPIMNPQTNQHYISSVSPYGLFAALQMDEFSIWYHFYEKEDFRGMVQKQYGEAFLPLLKELELNGIDALAAQIEKSALMDGTRWGRNKGIDEASRKQYYAECITQLKDFVAAREHYLTGLWIDGRESKKVYLDGGDADMYISYVEGLIGDVLEEPLAPEKEGYTFLRWLNGYTKEPYDFSQPYDGSDLYFVAQYQSDADGSILTAGE